MPSTFVHRGVTFKVTRQYDDQFEIAIEMDGETMRGTARTRLRAPADWALTARSAGLSHLHSPQALSSTKIRAIN